MIALKWKETRGATSGQWITELSSDLALEKPTHMAKGKIEDFFYKMQSFLIFTNNFNRRLDLHKDRCHRLHDLEMAYC